MQLAQHGDFKSARVLLKETLEAERATAKWLDDNIPAITARFLEPERAGITSKR